MIATCTAARLAGAACDTIPGVTRAFRGSLGVINRPFAGPGDTIDLRLVPVCDLASPGFAPLAEDHVVTVVFVPPDGPRNVVVLSTDCTPLQADLANCAARSDVDTATCLTANALGNRGDITVVQQNGERRLRVRFPDTDHLLDAPDDDHTFAGPATLAVTRVGTPLPCDLARDACAALPGLVACVDTLFTADGTCGTSPNTTFAHFTALPPANSYQALCVDPVPPCTGTAPEIRLALDIDGNILAPMDWRGILVGQGVPIPRLLRAVSAAEAFPGSGQPILVPDKDFLQSYSPHGTRLPPIFEPQFDPSEAGRALALFGSADAPQTVLRLARRSPTGFACSAGANASLLCQRSSDCPGGECLPATALFDFSTRIAGRVGPVLIPRFGAGTCQDTGEVCGNDSDCVSSRCVTYRFAAQDPVPLDGLVESQSLFAFVVSEAIDGKDLNGDGDISDDVVVPVDRRTGLTRAIGTGAAGRALTRVRQPPFSFPAVAIEEDILAFLEAEPHQGALPASTAAPGSDLNGDGDRADSILRVFRLGEGGAEDLTAAMNVAVDPAPQVSSQSVTVAAGRVYFRTPEFGGAPRVLEMVSVSPAGEIADGPSSNPAISADGRFVAFDSLATNLVPDDTNRVTDIFVRDLQTRRTERVSVSDSGAQSDGASQQPVISADGRFVAFNSRATNLVPDDTNGVADVFVHDRLSGTTERVSVATSVCAAGPRAGQPCDIDADCTPSACEPGEEANEASGGSFPQPGVAISGDGLVVAFRSSATNLVLNDLNGEDDVFVHDRRTGVTERVSVTSSGAQPFLGPSFRTTYGLSLNHDGSVVAFDSTFTDLVPGDSNDQPDVFIHDRRRRRTERVSIGNRGEEARDESRASSLDASGRLAVFLSYASNLVAGDTSYGPDMFVHDRSLQLTERLVANDTVAHAGRIDPSGRFIAFQARSNLDAPASDQPAVVPLQLYDRLTGFAEPLVPPDAEGPSSGFALSRGGRVVGFSDIEFPDLRFLGAIYVSTHAASSSCGNGGECDLNGDGDASDVVLQVLDTRLSPPRAKAIAAATTVVVDGDVAAFLVPEADQNAADLNGDGDTNDEVVHRSHRGAEAENLGRAATSLALSGAWLAATVSEESDGARDLNGDGDTGDRVVAVRAMDAEQWIDVGRAADQVSLSGSVAVFLTDEAAQGNRDLNGDGDADDRVLELFDIERRTLISVGLAAEDFVLSTELIAFRTSEAAQGETDLNGDGDVDDDVLQVYDLRNRRVVNTGQSVVPCRLEACDPRLPYRVRNNTVTFLTLEADQGNADLNGDGDGSDLVLQTVNVPLAAASGGAGASGAQALGRTRVRRGIMRTAALTTIASVSAGVCTTNGTACAADADCGGGICFVPPGGCIEDLGICCDADPEDGANPCKGAGGNCGADQFCQPVPDGEGAGTCRRHQGPCRSAQDCPRGAACVDADQTFQRLVGPLAAPSSGGAVFTSGGRCVADTGFACDSGQTCPSGATCTSSGICERQGDTCLTDADCETEAICRPDLVAGTAIDSDGDELLDPFDNCPQVANVMQEDTDGDGTGDACEAGAPTPPPPTPTHTRTSSPTLAVMDPTATASATGSGMPTASATPTATVPTSTPPTPQPSTTSTRTPSRTPVATHTPVAVCAPTADPCIIDRAYSFASDATIDLGERALLITPDGSLEVSSGFLFILAGDVTIAAGGLIDTSGPAGENGADLTLFATSLNLAGVIRARGVFGGYVELDTIGTMDIGGRIDVGGTEGGGIVDLYAAELRISGHIEGRGEFGSLNGTAEGPLTVSGTLDFSGGEGSVELESDGPLTFGETAIARVDAHGSENSGGEVAFTTFNRGSETGRQLDLVVDGLVSATGDAGGGGEITIDSEGDLRVGTTARLRAGAAGSFASGGSVSLDAVGHIKVDAAIDNSASGTDSQGGDINLEGSTTTCSAPLTARGAGDSGFVAIGARHRTTIAEACRIDLRSRPGGFGGFVLLDGEEVVVSGNVAVDGEGARDGFSGRSGHIIVEARTSVLVDADLTADGSRSGSGGEGGEIEIVVDHGSATLNGRLSATSFRPSAAAGRIRLQTATGLTITGEVDASARAGRAGTIAARSGGPLTISGQVVASAGSGGQGGRVEILSRARLSITGAVHADSTQVGEPAGAIVAEGCIVDLAPGSRLSSLGSRGLNRLFGRTSMLIRGSVEADLATGQNELVTGDGSASPRVLDPGRMTPAARRRYELSVTSCAVCGDGAVESPETCDDGNTKDRDGCSAACTIETVNTPTISAMPTIAASPTPTPRSTPSPSPSSTSAPPGLHDLNGDGCVTAADVVRVVQLITTGAANGEDAGIIIGALFTPCETG